MCNGLQFLFCLHRHMKKRKGADASGLAQQKPRHPGHPMAPFGGLATHSLLSEIKPAQNLITEAIVELIGPSCPVRKLGDIQFGLFYDPLKSSVSFASVVRSLIPEKLDR